MSRIRQLGKDSIVYGLGGIFGKGIGVFFLPVYTRVFSPAEYGDIEMLVTLSSLLGAVMIMGMDSAQSLYFFEQRRHGVERQRRLVTAILQWRLLWGGITMIVAALLVPQLNAWLFGGQLDWLDFLTAFSAVFFLQVMSQSTELFRLLYRPWPYVLLTAGQSLGAAGLGLLAILVFGLGITGFFAGSALASLFAALVGWWMARSYVQWDRWHRDWWPRLLRFGAPLLPAALALYVMSTADRWFIQQYRGSAELGIYSVAAKLGLAMAFTVETFRKAWWPIGMDAMQSDDGQVTFRMIGRMYMGVGIAAVVYVTFLAPWLVHWMAAPAYYNAYPIVGIMAWQALFYGFYLIASAGIWRAEKTYLSAWLMGAAAVLNAVLNWLLVPSWGGLGAALATAISYCVWVFLSYAVSERYWPIRLPVQFIAVAILLGILGQFLLLEMQKEREGVLSALLAHALALTLIVFSLDRVHRIRLAARVSSFLTGRRM